MLEVVISATAIEAAVRLLVDVMVREVYEELGLTGEQIGEVLNLKSKLGRMLEEETDLHIMSKAG